MYEFGPNRIRVDLNQGSPRESGGVLLPEIYTDPLTDEPYKIQPPSDKIHDQIVNSMVMDDSVGSYGFTIEKGLAKIMGKVQWETVTLVNHFNMLDKHAIELYEHLDSLSANWSNFLDVLRGKFFTVTFTQGLCLQYKGDERRIFEVIQPIRLNMYISQISAKLHTETLPNGSIIYFPRGYLGAPNLIREGQQTPKSSGVR